MINGFADILIANITAGQINHYFAEIAPRTVYLLYVIVASFPIINVCFLHHKYVCICNMQTIIYCAMYFSFNMICHCG